MKSWDAYSDGDITKALICFADINHFVKATQFMPLPKVAGLLKDVAEITFQFVSDANGKIIKYIGDASLMIFHEDNIDTSIGLILNLKDKIDKYLSSCDATMTVTFSLTYGEIIFAQLKPFSTLDIFSNAVNQAALLNNPTHRGKVVIGEEVMQRINEKIRAQFIKSQQPGAYIAK